MNWWQKLFGKGQHAPSTDTSAPLASQRSIEECRSPQQPEGSLCEFDRLNQLQDLGTFLKGRSEEQIESFVQGFPFSDIHLDYASVETDFRNCRRTEMVLYLARVLLRWKDYASNPAWRNLLPNSLNAARLYDVLSSRIFAFLESQRGTDIAMVLRTALYDFAMDLVREDKNREAILCLEISRPSPREDHDFWLCACYHNIGKLEQDKDVIGRGVKLAQEMMDGKAKTSPSVVAKMQQVDLLGKLKTMACEL